MVFFGGGLADDLDIFIFFELATVEAGLFPLRFAELRCEVLGWD